jgi:hypothetical protein
MSILVTTIPSQPIENVNFFLNYSEINNIPQSQNTYILKDENDIDVSDTFIVPQNGVYFGNFVNSLESCSYLIKDTNNNFYFTNNKSFNQDPGNYNVYKATVNPNSIINYISELEQFNPNSISVFISYLSEPELINSNPIGLAIDSQGYFYVALQTANKIKRYNANGTGGTNFITGLNRPCGLAFDSSDNLYVANSVSNNVLKYNSSGTLLTTITNAGFNQPCAIAFNNIGELFVANVGIQIFKISLPSNTVSLINTLSGRQSANMTFDRDNNIYLPNFNNKLIQKLTYSTWISDITYLNQILPIASRIGGIITNRFGDIIIITTDNSNIRIQAVQLFLTYSFNNVNLSAGYRTLKIKNITGLPTTVAQFTIYIKGTEPEPGVICFKEGTKILCKINRQDVYIPVENIEEGTLVKTYKNGYKKCKFCMKELLHNKKEHSINNLFKLSKHINTNLFEDLFITGSHSMLYDNLSEKEEEAMNKLLSLYNSTFDIGISNKIEDKYKLIAYYDKSFTEIRKDINVNIYHLVLEGDNKHRNYGIWANGIITESIDEISLFHHLKNSDIKLINVAKQNNKILDNVFLSKGNMTLKIDNSKLGNKQITIC